MSDTRLQPSEISEAVVKAIVGLLAASDDIVRSLAYVLVWHLRRMPTDEAEAALGYLFDLLAAHGFVGVMSDDVGHS